MSKARLVITAIEIEGRSVTEVATSYQVSRSWIYELLARYRTEGDAAFESRSRRPKTSPTATPQSTIDLIVTTRKQLAEVGLDAGPDTIAWHLEHRHQVVVSVSTIARTLTRQSLVEPQPKKRPKSSYIRFAAEQPNQTWQSDFTHYRLSTEQDTEVLTWLDDHSRYALHVSAHPRISGRIVVDTFTETHRATPTTAYTARPKAGPSADRSTDTHYRVLNDKVDSLGKLSLRLNGRMHHIGIGAEHARTQVLKLVDGLHIRVVNAATGELLRELTIDPSRDYQPLGRPPGPKPKTRKPDPRSGSGLSGIS